MRSPLTRLWFAILSVAMSLTLVAPARGQLRPEIPADGGLAAVDLRCDGLRNPLAVTSLQPRLGWRLISTRERARGQLQSAYQVIVATDVEILAAGTGDLWDSGRVESSASAHITFEGRMPAVGRSAYWRVRVWDEDREVSAWSDVAEWRVGPRSRDDWQGAQWIGAAESALAEGDDAQQPATVLRTGFDLGIFPGNVKRATLYVTSLGLHEVHINGQRIGDHELAPEWTDFTRRVQYQAYDVTLVLRPNRNALGVLLGHGWYAGRIGLANVVPDGPRRGIYGRTPRLLLMLDLEYLDGTHRTIVSNDTWRVTTDGPIVHNDLLDGETVDARKIMPGWNHADFDDFAWDPVTIHPDPPIEIVPQVNEPIRITEDVPPVSVTMIAPGRIIVDFGQNLTGWCRLQCTAIEGTRVTLRHGEMLNPDGTLYVENLRTAAQTDTYIARGLGIAEYNEPRFTYHGFRYVEITGLDRVDALDAISASVVHSASSRTMTFACSSELINQLVTNIDWTQRGNMHGVPTDCPQRDERLGWMGDFQVFLPTAWFNRDMTTFVRKWLVDVRDAQTAVGRFPDFAPHPFDPQARFAGAPGWADAGVLVPWTAYVYSGDRRFLEENFDSARRWVDFVVDANPDLIWRNGRGNDYGDWLNGDTLDIPAWPSRGAEVPKAVFATAYLYRSTITLAQMAEVLGERESGRFYRDLAGEIRARFQSEFLADGLLQGDTQAGWALALEFGLLPETMRAHAIDRIINGINFFGGHLSTGFHATPRLLNQLSRNGEHDLACRLVQDRSLPSWGYAIAQGATTIWERWDGYTAQRGFQDPGMNSFNHYAFGAVGAWIYTHVLGLQPDERVPGFARFTVQPRPGEGLTWARGTYDSVRGPITIDWSTGDGAFRVTVDVPPNTQATVVIPCTDAEALTESGRSLRTARGVTEIGRSRSSVTCVVGSGRYEFVAPWTSSNR